MIGDVVANDGIRDRDLDNVDKLAVMIIV